jgi:hypothetical protein
MNTESSSDEPPLLSLHVQAHDDSSHPERSPLGIFTVDDDVQPAIFSLQRLTALRCETLEEQPAYTPKDLETICAVQDAFEMTVSPNCSMSKDEYLAWAEEKMGEPGATDDGKRHVFLSYDGAVHSVSFMHEAQEHRILYFDHHHPDDPHGTRSCCHQTLTAIENGSFIAAADAAIPHVIHERMIDCDQDVCLTQWLSRNWRKLLADPSLLEKMRALVEMEDTFDIYAGFVPVDFDDPEQDTLFRQQVWIFEPYSAWRKNGKAADALEMAMVMNEVSKRIDAYAAGTAQLGEIDTDYKELDSGFGWMMIDEASGQQAKHELLNEARVVIAVADLGDNRWRHTISQVDEEFLPMTVVPVAADLEGLCEYLNYIDGIAPDATDRWGGRKGIVIGSPKQAKSGIKPETLTKIVESFLYPQLPPSKRQTARVQLRGEAIGGSWESVSLLSVKAA